MGRVFKWASEAELRIDGTDVAVGEAWTHYQDEPWPGGHRYVLMLRGRLADKFVKRHGTPVASGLGRDETSSILNYVYSDLWMFGYRRPNQTVRYVLNTIDQIELRTEEVTMAGICSPFVRAAQSDVSR
jgi:hypothetical protein